MILLIRSQSRQKLVELDKIKVNFVINQFKIGGFAKKLVFFLMVSLKVLLFYEF